MTLVVDASVVVAALVDDGEVGRWAEALLTRTDLTAPHLMAFEAANVLRRSVLRGYISSEAAQLAHADLRDLVVDFVGYEVLAARAWALRDAVTLYDAAYVALAEMSEASLLTLDLRLTRAPGVRCPFLVPGDPLP